MKQMFFLEFSCFFYDPAVVGNLISDSSGFSKSSFYIYKFSVHRLLKPSLKDFEHYLASMWNECNCVVVWTFFGIALLWDWNIMYIFTLNNAVSHLIHIRELWGVGTGGGQGYREYSSQSHPANCLGLGPGQHPLPSCSQKANPTFNPPILSLHNLQLCTLFSIFSAATRYCDF